MHLVKRDQQYPNQCICLVIKYSVNKTPIKERRPTTQCPFFGSIRMRTFFTVLHMPFWSIRFTY